MSMSSSRTICLKREIISSIQSSESHDGNSTGNRMLCRPRTWNRLHLFLKMSKSSQQTGQLRFDTAIMVWSMFCASHQTDEHRGHTNKTLPGGHQRGGGAF